MRFGFTTSSFFPGQFNKSEDDFETPEVFPAKCAICIRRLANVGVTSEAETRSKTTVDPIDLHCM